MRPLASLAGVGNYRPPYNSPYDGHTPPGPESGQVRLLLHIRDDVLRFVIHLVQRDDNFDLVLTAFNEGHVRVVRYGQNS